MPTYFPALRFKQGEYYALAKLAPDIRRHVGPRFILPPPKERDPEKGSPLTADEIAYFTGDRVGRFWPSYPAFLDAQYVAPYIGSDGLRTLYRIAQGRNGRLVPIATVEDLIGGVYQQFLRPMTPKIGIYLHFEKIDVSQLLDGVKAIGCTPEDCILFVDFTGASFEVEGAAFSVAYVFDVLGNSAKWNRIVFQGSAFPVKNPASDEGQIDVPRLERTTFLEALEECSIPPDLIAYGDYAADCGEINFPRKGGGVPIRHIRYTTSKFTRVIRGAESGSQGQSIQGVCNKLIGSECYLGQGMSYADDMFWRVAKGLSAGGTPSMWREWNTAHHISFVVREIGARSGMAFADSRISELSHQYSLLDMIGES